MDISFFILTLLNSLVMIFAASKLLNYKINYKNYKFYLVLAFLTIYTFTIYQMTHSFYRVLITLQMYFLCNWFLYKREDIKLNKIMIISLFNWLLFGLCEVLAVILLGLVFRIFGLEIDYAMMGTDLPAIAIIIIFSITICDKMIVRFIKKLLNKIFNIKIPGLFLVIIFLSTVFAMMMYLTNFELKVTDKMLILLLIILEYSLFLYNTLMEKHKSLELQEKLDTMVNVTSEYEDMLEENRITNHENKNQLIVIKDMISPDNKEAIKYIDKMIKTTYKDDSNLHLMVSKIPLGGLRGLVYYKLLAMKNNKIDFIMNVDKGIKKDVFSNINTELLQNLCKIVGVFLDNAIEAVAGLEEKIVGIEMYLDDSFFVISISNEFTSKIDFESLGKKKYSSKGANRGAGLRLVERIIKENKDLFNEKVVSNGLFTQKVKMNLK